MGEGALPPQRCQRVGRRRRCHLEPPRHARSRRCASTRCATRPAWTVTAPGSRRLAGCNSWTAHLRSTQAKSGGEVRAWTFPGTSRRPQGTRQDGTGGGREPKCGFGLAATPTSCNHLQPLECTGETREIYLFIVGLCGQWVFLMKTICFCVFPENIIP